MPNTGMMNNQTFKCEKCRRNFKDIWLPSNVCCQIAKLEVDGKSPTNDSKASYSRYATLRPTKERVRRELERHFERLESDVPTKKEKSEVKLDGMGRLQRNKLAPFSTLEKPTCGFSFSRQTDNRKKNFGILPSNLVKWRSEKIEKIAT